jgi:hypothetical protein
MLEITSGPIARGVLRISNLEIGLSRDLVVPTTAGQIPSRGLGLMDRGNAKRQRFRKTSLRGDNVIGVVAGVLDLVARDLNRHQRQRPRPQWPHHDRGP